MFAFCEACELALVCKWLVVTIPSIQTVRDPAFRIECQNYMVRVGIPYRQLVDFVIDAIADFPGRYRFEDGSGAPVPGFAPWLTPGIEWWLRDLVEGGSWKTVKDVPRLRSEAVRRYVLIRVAMDIRETVSWTTPTGARSCTRECNDHGSERGCGRTAQGQVPVQ